MHKWLIFMMLVAGPPVIAADDDLTKLKEELKHQQEVLQQLEARIHQMEAVQVHPEETGPEHHHRMPEIAFVMDMTWINRDVTNASFSEQTVPGFEPSGHSHQHDSRNQRGFNLNYGELVLRAALSPRSSLHAAFHLTEDRFEIEEAYLDWSLHQQGWETRIGKFRSGFSLVNRVHPHARDFADAPLVQSLLFGEHGLIENGVRLGWTGTAEHTLSIAMEWLQGTNSESFGDQGFDWNETTIPGGKGADLITAYLDAGTAIGPFNLTGGISAARGTRRMIRSDIADDDHKATWSGMYTIEHTEPLMAEYGDADLFGLRLKMEYPRSHESRITITSEYLRRTVSGTGFSEFESAVLERKQAGWYASLVYQWDHRWRAGIRYDRVQRNRLVFGEADIHLPDGMDRLTGMVEYHPPVPLRIRIQYSHDNAHWIDQDPSGYNELVVQFTVTVGNHAGHDHQDTCIH